MAADNNEGKAKIQLNRKMRLWHKYKNPVIIIAVVIVIAAVAGVSLKIGSTGKQENNKTTQASDNNANNNIVASSKEEQTTASNTSDNQNNQSTDSTTQTTQATNVVSANVVKITDTAGEESFTSKDDFNNAVLFGDMIIAGIGDYGYLGSANIVSDNNLTTDKALNYISDVKEKNPSKVYVLVGLNDLNYGTRTAQDMADRIGNIVTSIKQSMPSTNVYVISLLPVTQEFEDKASVKIKQTDIDAVNKLLSERAATMGMTFIDVADCFKDATGYLNTKYSSGGYNLNHNYYPFFLNKIAGASK